MRIQVNFDPDLRQIMAAEAMSGEIAVTRSMRLAGRAVKANWRDQITRAGLGQRLPRTIRDKAFPETGESIDAAALIWSKAPEIVGAFDRGVTIRSKDGFYLAIPLPAAGPRGRRKITPGLWESRTGIRLRFVYRRGRASLLVADDARISARGMAARKGGRRRRDGTLTGAQTVPIFVLVPQVRLQKRLDLSAGVQGVLGRLPQMIVDDWARQSGRVRNG